jgi:hypothetical protein
MRCHRLAGVHRRRWRYAKRSEATWPDRVQRRFVADAPDRLWVTPFGYAQWAQTAGWAALGNIVGGVGLVTLLRIAQVTHVLQEERRNPAPGVSIGDDRRDGRGGASAH